ncbi:Polyribonucleotide nucleotidyltransferase [Candidatus Portiera aleyrodidarum]|uniref:Polyribonucleotide nucleotidyltransferase n=1 Tax=Candidatus Portiera aleyrodidarum TaxID=91844 RepID=A0A6S6RRT4_9GAMM|nr:polyribonucleotide nucleotidyltransferase [Candidatus Portiera aleyrodidarum]CAA3704304.1 Polyribonucleotide nucleotidyltransferase [Candidatus Portiera aleyrodidarum]
MSLYLKKTFKYGGKYISLETGKIAKNSNGSVVIQIDNTVVLCTVVVNKNIKNTECFPLSVTYQEKIYAAGKIPGGFFKREGRPTEKEILTSRLIDRPIRPNIKNFYKNEVQIICTVLSAENNPDIAAMIGAYAAIGISEIPLLYTMGVARVGFNKEIGYWLNITHEINSEIDIVVAGTKNSVLMVEAEAKEKTEAIILGAICYAHKKMQVVIKSINEFVEDLKKNKKKTTSKNNKKKVNIFLKNKLIKDFIFNIKDTFYIMETFKRKEALIITINQVLEKFNNDFKNDKINDILNLIIKKIFRNKIFKTNKRMDGRNLKTIRSLSIELGILPKTHGSALFSRGDTQAITTITLGRLRDAQVIEGLEEERYEKIMFHYNFTPYSVGEIGFLGIPKRREIGHGNLAKRAIIGVLSKKAFPYSIRIVSEITESNGSSSMASVCGASLALMDAGVPLSSTVAGVAMGLITKKEQFLILTDIVGEEDKFGDMDLKVAGTNKGITALQMDIKKQQGKEIDHKEIIQLTLNQAKEAIKKISQKMNVVISQSRKKISNKAPSNKIFKIETEKLRNVIGKGGAIIKKICESTNSKIDIFDDGKIHVSANNKINSQKAIEAIKIITEEAKLNKIYRGKVIRIMDFGAFVNLKPGTDGLVHISQISSGHVKNIRDFLNVGDIVTVKVLDKDNKGKIKLSIKDIDPMEKAEFEAKISN